MENCIVNQLRVLIKQWSFGFIESSPLTRSKIHEKLFWFHTRVLFSASRRSIILLVNYDSCWQRQMSVRALRHDRLSGRFSKSRVLSASVSFLSSPLPLRSFTCAIFRAVFDSRSSFFAPKPHGNSCYAGYRFEEMVYTLDVIAPIFSFVELVQLPKRGHDSRRLPFLCLRCSARPYTFLVAKNVAYRATKRLKYFQWTQRVNKHMVRTNRTTRQGSREP